MTRIQKIKDDLTKISKWPWEAQSDNETTISVTGELLTHYDAEFALRCPERITSLVEYYEAAEAWLKACKDSIAGIPLTRCRTRLRKAREELERQE